MYSSGYEKQPVAISTILKCAVNFRINTFLFIHIVQSGHMYKRKGHLP